MLDKLIFNFIKRVNVGVQDKSLISTTVPTTLAVAGQGTHLTAKVVSTVTSQKKLKICPANECGTKLRFYLLFLKFVMNEMQK